MSETIFDGSLSRADRADLERALTDVAEQRDRATQERDELLEAIHKFVEEAEPGHLHEIIDRIQPKGGDADADARRLGRPRGGHVARGGSAEQSGSAPETSEAALKRVLAYCEEMEDACDVLRDYALKCDDEVAAAVHAEGRNTNRDVARRIRQELEGDRP